MEFRRVLFRSPPLRAHGRRSGARCDHSPTTDRRSDSRHAPPRPELPARVAAAAILRLLAYRAPRPVVSRRVSPRSPPTRMRMPAGRVRFSPSTSALHPSLQPVSLPRAPPSLQLFDGPAHTQNITPTPVQT